MGQPTLFFNDMYADGTRRAGADHFAAPQAKRQKGSGRSDHHHHNNNNHNNNKNSGGDDNGHGRDFDFSVLSADKKTALVIPQHLIEVTAGSQRYIARTQSNNAPAFTFCLCNKFTKDSVCAHGLLCDFIHSRHVLDEAPSCQKQVKINEVHWSRPVHSVSEAPYERLKPGVVIYIGPADMSGSASHTSSNTTNPQRLASENVYRTKGSENALHHGPNKLFRLCKHYEREKCALGEKCKFIHRVHLASISTSSQSSSTPAASILGPASPDCNQVCGTNVSSFSQPRVDPQPLFLTCLPGSPQLLSQQLNVNAFAAEGVPRANDGAIGPSLSSPQPCQQPQNFTGAPQGVLNSVYTSQYGPCTNNCGALFPVIAQGSSLSCGPPQQQDAQPRQLILEPSQAPVIMVPFVPDYISHLLPTCTSVPQA